ncbi:DUF6328 family protein [Quadrisphaera sp. GCM10027208]|uniref:DUF6328 family protein n=1 Tax=Quadrisphaera sp. GCM10027208 TaxID=3273423 RepID=UPI003608CFA9
MTSDQIGINPVSGRRETENERLDRNLNELLQELRVAQTGVQILFAFLLTAAFTPLMQDADPFTRRVLVATIVCAALATALLIAPVALHRTVFRRGLKEELVRISSRLAAGGLVLLGLTMLGGCLLAVDALVDRPVAFVLTAGVGVWFLVFWAVLPVRVRTRGRGAGSAPPE